MGVVGCTTWADERNAFYYAQYKECLQGALVIGYSMTPESWPREKRCYKVYTENIDELNYALATGGPVIQPVYILNH